VSQDTPKDSGEAGLSQLAEGAAEMELPLSAGQLELFQRYQVLLLDWNRRLNLTAIRDQAGIQLRHFLDSLSCAKVTGDLTGRRLADVGAGAGFPGLPLKILYPELELTLVESVAKKARFLEAAVAELELSGVSIVVDRAENVGRMAGHREGYDWAVARAVAALPTLAEYLLPLCRLGGRMLAQKGPKAAAEVEEAAWAIEVLGGGRVAVHEVQVPGLDETRVLVVVEKVTPTPIIYPRRPGMPGKAPLAGG
jgi:16S rRNA (guanine527-N7)-methyltransferase